MSILDDGHPAHHALNGDKNEDVSPTRAAIELGVTRGYSMALDRIRMMGVPSKIPEPMPESEYTSEETEERKGE
jgi:hypothetical protein